jgi:DNA-binding transcriptional LysR family regulator
MSNRLVSMSVFAQVVDAKSFSAAADKLGMSKSLASRHVSALERALSVKLLHRSTRRLALTEAGVLFYEHCARVVQEAQAAEEAVTRAQSEPAGLVKISAVPAFAVRHVVPALPDFHRQYPHIRVKLSCTNRAVDLAEEGFDVGIRISMKPDPNLVARKLADNRNALAASPGYLAAHGAPRRVDDLRKRDFVLFPPVAPKGAMTLRSEGQRHAIAVGGVLETDEMDAVRAAVVEGLGIGVLPLYMAGEAFRRGELVPVLRRYRVVPESAIYLVWLPNRTLPSRVRALIDFLTARFGPVPPWEVGW